VSAILLEELQANHKLQKSGTDWYGLKCPFCGDSGKHNSRHLHIRIPKDPNDTLYGIKCFKPGCGKSGILNVHDLQKLGVKSRAVHDFLKDHEISSAALVYNLEKRVLHNITLQGCDVKRYEPIDTYFKKRTNIDLTDVYGDLRIIPDVKKFMDLNAHLIKTKSDKRWNYLYDHPEDCIVFINKTFTRLFVRYILNPRKHDKIDIVKFDFMLSHCNYTLEKNVVENQITGLKGFIGEGIFDIVNTFLHYTDRSGSLLEATGGIEGYLKVFMSMSRQYYDINYIFLKDSDVSESYFMNLYKKYMYRFKYNPFILYSENTKDNGDMSLNPIVRTKQISE
jgi:hypothetical protein